MDGSALLLFFAVFAAIIALFYFMSLQDREETGHSAPTTDPAPAFKTNPPKIPESTESIYSFQSTAFAIHCPHCDGENPPANTQCQICGEKLNQKEYGYDL